MGDIDIPPDIKGFPLSEGWTLETADHATVFVQYRGVDVIAIWTPLDDPTATPNITMPSLAQIHEMRAQAVDDRDPYVVWACAGEYQLNLDGLTGAVDQLRDEIDRLDAEELRFPVEDWRQEVANGGTTRGYRDWLDRKVGR